MSKKPSLTISKQKRLTEAKKELKLEGVDTVGPKTKQTTIILEADLLYAAKEVALKRKRAGIEPNTITGMVRKALQEIVHKELKG